MKAPKTQEEIYDYMKSLLEPEEEEEGIPNLLEMIAGFPGTPMMAKKKPGTEAKPLTSNAISRIIPNMGKIQENMKENEILAKYPGLKV